MKQKTLFINFKELLLNQIKPIILEGDSPTLNFLGFGGEEKQICVSSIINNKSNVWLNFEKYQRGNKTILS